MAVAAVLNLICFGDAKKCNSDTELCDLSLFGASNLSAFFQSTICHGHLINVVLVMKKASFVGHYHINEVMKLFFI